MNGSLCGGGSLRIIKQVNTVEDHYSRLMLLLPYSVLKPSVFRLRRLKGFSFSNPEIRRYPSRIVLADRFLQRADRFAIGARLPSRCPCYDTTRRFNLRRTFFVLKTTRLFLREPQDSSISVKGAEGKRDPTADD